MATVLEPEQLTLLRDVLHRRRPDLIHLVTSDPNTLSRDERLRLCEVIAAEFAEKGLGEDFEPTANGLKLEELLNAINRPNLQGRP